MKIVACFVISFSLIFDKVSYSVWCSKILNRNQCLNVLCKHNGDRLISRYCMLSGKALWPVIHQIDKMQHYRLSFYDNMRIVNCNQFVYARIKRKVFYFDKTWIQDCGRYNKIMQKDGWISQADISICYASKQQIWQFTNLTSNL